MDIERFTDWLRRASKASMAGAPGALVRFNDFEAADFPGAVDELVVHFGSPDLCAGAGRHDDEPAMLLSRELANLGQVAGWDFDYYSIVLHGLPELSLEFQALRTGW